MEQNKETTMQEQEPNISSSVIYHIEKVSKRWVIFASVAFATLGITLGGALLHQMNINQQNEKDWKELFSDYDFISQDGEGINNANYGEQGDLLNGAEDKVKEKPSDQ